MLGTFVIKWCVAFNLIVLGALKKDCDIETNEMLSFLLLKNNTLNIGLNFLLASISAIVSSNTIIVF